MPDSDDDPGDSSLDETAELLYGLHPDDFVPARDDAVARAREQGDRDLARAVGRLRRPTRAAWLANLLARQRADQLDGLLMLAGDLASAQRTLDGDALRALSSQRHRLVAAMAREAGRLAREVGVPAGDSLLRELQGILEAALADPAVATEVRSGRLTRTVTYSGFGPGAEPGAVPSPPRRAAPDDTDSSDSPQPEPDRQALEREQRERERRERDLAEAEREEAAARDQQEIAEAARDDADADHRAAREQVADLTAELDAARERERAAAARARAAGATAKDAARAAGVAATRAARARARLEGDP